MQDWVKIAGVVLLLAVIYRSCRSGEAFVPTVTTQTARPSHGTLMTDATGLPLTDATSGLPTPVGCTAPQSIDTDLLPRPCARGDDSYGDFAPNPSVLANQSYLEPAKFIGMDTTTGSKRNQSRDLRLDPTIPACPGAWGHVYQSTISADPWRKNLFTC